MAGGDSPLVGVVVAAYQAERYLASALESVRDQTYRRWVCVVVDDGSSDGTAAAAETFIGLDGRFSLLRRANGGVSSARNAGLASLPHAVEYLCFLDSDDRLVADALDVLVAALARRPDAAGASGWSERIDGEGRLTEPGRQRELQTARPVGDGLRSRLLRPDEDTTFESLLLYGSVSPPATAVVRRGAAVDVGGFDPGLTCHEDGDFWLRVARIAPLAYVDRQVAWYRRHDVNATARTADCLRMAHLVRRRAWSSPANSPQQRRTALLANLRTHSWELALAVRRARRAWRERRPGPLAWSALSALATAAEMLALRPVVPPEWLAGAIAALDRRCGFDAAGRW